MSFRARKSAPVSARVVRADGERVPSAGTSEAVRACLSMNSRVRAAVSIWSLAWSLSARQTLPRGLVHNGTVLGVSEHAGYRAGSEVLRPRTAAARPRSANEIGSPKPGRSTRSSWPKAAATAAKHGPGLVPQLDRTDDEAGPVQCVRNREKMACSYDVAHRLE